MATSSLLKDLYLKNNTMFLKEFKSNKYLNTIKKALPSSVKKN